LRNFINNSQRQALIHQWYLSKVSSLRNSLYKVAVELTFEKFHHKLATAAAAGAEPFMVFLKSQLTAKLTIQSDCRTDY